MLIAWIKKKLWQAGPNALAYALFKVCTGVATVLFDLFMIDFTIIQTALTRIPRVSVEFAFSWLCALLQDKTDQNISGGTANGILIFLRRIDKSISTGAVTGTLALLLYIVPLHIISSYLVGATTHQLKMSAVSHTVNILMFGWLYNVLRKRFRRLASKYSNKK